MRKLLLISMMIVAGCNRYCDHKSSVRETPPRTLPSSDIVYSNPRVYNVDYSFELVPDPNKIDRARDLKLWIPIPREWDSQKAVKIISVQPEPHARYVDPEYGNPMLFWDFGKGPEQSSYKVDIKFRLESYKIDVEVDPEQVGPYDKTSKEYALYTRSTHMICITPKIKQMAQEAIGDETNPYLQANRIAEFVNRKMYYKILDFERGRGIKCLLDYPVIDEKGDEHYEGCCSQRTALIVALCRAVGIPARSVKVFLGWCPWMGAEDLRPGFEFETKLSPDGLAGAQHYGGLSAHMTGEFYIPNYGWIPVFEECGHRHNWQWISSIGRDVKIGPHAPQEQSEGYGSQWVSLNNGRADMLFSAVWNIAKIRTAKVKVLHRSDPFPADGLAGYPENSLQSEDAERDLRHWRQRALSWPSYFARSSVPDNLDLEQFYDDDLRVKDDREAFVCHMLRRQLGDETFFQLVKTYVDLRQKSGQAVPTSRFQELAEDISGQSLDWFFNQWVNSTELPRLKLEKVTVSKDTEAWQVQGRLVQLGDKTFRLPIELALDTKNGRERLKLWIEKKSIDFDFRTLDAPQKLIVDPEYEVLKVQRMAPRLWWFWSVYPQIIIVYGTLGETEANKTAAERFNSDYLGLGREFIKADTDVNDADLKTKCVFLIGRPKTNKIAQQFKDIFPIKFEKNKFAWQGVTYAQPTQAVAQIAGNPKDAQSLIIMHAALSPEATQKFPYSYLGRADSTYVIFDGDRQLLTGDCEEADSDLYQKFDTHPSIQSAPNEQ